MCSIHKRLIKILKKAEIFLHHSIPGCTTRQA
jgi:hypothetical protein